MAERALYWQNETVLFVADLHLGKEHAFGQRGIAIPGGSTENTLRRLSTCLTLSGASECIVLGDFFHATPQPGESWLTRVSAFLDTHPGVSVSVVAGNHDKALGQSMIDDRILWHSEPIQRDPFVLQHEPGSDPRGYVLAGHIHPVVSINPPRGRSLRGPCFWQQPDGMVLPAFGDFTGGFKVTPSSTDSVFLTGPDCVIPIPTNAANPKRRRARTS